MSTQIAPLVTECAEVAVPVPLRRSFTYRVPELLRGRLEPGSRVAVPFGSRKLAAFVLGGAEPPASGKLKDIAGLLDAQPLFSAELLAFLREAAEYYLHPFGEVLRAAAPALPSEALTRLRSDGFLEQGETLPGARIATRRVLVVRSSAARAQDDLRLGKNQRWLLELLAERGEVTLDELRRHVKNPRALTRALADKGLIETNEREVPADRFFANEVLRDGAPEPNSAQALAIAMLTEHLGRGGGFLLHGVTGSGKTEVYLRLIAEARRRELGALVLVPEIALTPQLVSRFRARFGDEIAVLHSDLTERERNDAWRGLRQGRVRLAIGARSALFAPIAKLGVLVVDEEHDGSFKQEEGFRYHARDMALLRAARASAVCVLGSATPSLESHELARRGKLTLLALEQRATAQSLPRVEIVDLARHKSGPSGERMLSAPLHRAIERCLDAREQAILFLNRRGFSPAVYCDGCGELLQCPACSVALTVHRGARLLRCHYCDFSTPNTGICFRCGEPQLHELGLGTEQLEQTLARVFPKARVARLDRDTASGEGVEAVLERLRAHEIDILVGTQMVTKGHDVPDVTLVGVVLAEQSLGFPDFRAAERTFQLLVQVSGRAGRGERAGQVFMQTHMPEHPAIACAQAQDYAAFVEDERAARREHGYPPFARLIAVRIEAGAADEAEGAALLLARFLRGQRAVRAREVDVLGPAPAPIERLRGRYRYRMFLRAAVLRPLRETALALAERLSQGVAPARATLDVDPVSML